MATTIPTPCTEQGGDLWFADGIKKRDAAKALCFTCPLRQACLEVALQAREVWGIWGGLDADERKHLQLQTARSGELVIVPVAA